MTGIDITVRGSHSIDEPPQRATIRVAVVIDAGDAASAYGDVARSTDVVRASLEPLHEPQRGPVTTWSSDDIHTWATRPWHQEGKVLPLVHHARASFSATFSDFAALAPWLGSIVELPGAAVEGVEWTLTPERRATVLAEVRKAAVLDAVVKAQAYADAIDAGTVRVVAIADAGMLSPGAPPFGDPSPKFTRIAMATADAAPVELTPADLSVSVDVDVRCTTTA